MITYFDLEKLTDVLSVRGDDEAKKGLKTVGILLDELTEFYTQSSRAGISALMAPFFEELGKPVPEEDATQKVAEGLQRITELFEKVNVLFEKDGFSCRFDLCDENEALAEQVKIIVTEMIKSGMNNYLNRK